MAASRMNRLAARARVIKAMAHASRLLILEELANGERCVADLTAIVGTDVSTVSKHLSVLKSVGIVGSQRRGAHVYYSLRVPCVLNFFGCVEAVLQSSAEEQISYLSPDEPR